MTLYLVRHAHAGSRAGWAGADDFERPLSDKGQSQARYFAGHVEARPIRKLWSSPAVRCIQTLEPLAEALDLEVREADELAEGADPDRAIEFLLAHTRHDAVFCSHGDLIPKVIRRLTAAGMRTSDAEHRHQGLVVDARRRRRPDHGRVVLAPRHRLIAGPSAPDPGDGVGGRDGCGRTGRGGRVGAVELGLEPRAQRLDQPGHVRRQRPLLDGVEVGQAPARGSPGR